MASRVPKLYQKQKKLNSLYYLKKAKQACSQNSYAEAYEFFVNYFESLDDPSRSSGAVQTAFTKLVCKIGTVLEETDNIEELLKCYLQAINLFPNNYTILNNLGAYMFKVGETDIAKRYLELAVKVNKDYLPAEKNLMHVKWHQLPRWHFRMLNDRLRNTAYDNAINQTISKGYYNVIDIGSGCGLLSLLASRNPLANVTAIEENKMLYKMCLDILKENETSNVQCLNIYSTDLPGAPCKCNLLVTEIFDVALFGERALESIYHASTVLRTEEDYKIIPCAAKLYVTGIHSEELASKNWYIPSDVLKVLNMGTARIKQHKAEPYEAENLSGTNLEYMTDTQEVFHVNFYNRDQICLMLTEDKYYEIIQLKCKRGVLHALAVWFDLNLTEEISITTNPSDPQCVKCWEQAVFYLDQPLSVEEDEIVTVKVTVVDCKLKFSVVDSLQSEYFEVSKEIISFLNDSTLVDCIVRLADQYNRPDLVVIDMNIFPLFGLLTAKNNNSTVYHTLKNDADIDFIKYILALNNIPLEKFIIFDNKIDFTPGANLNQQCIYFYNPINVDGSLENVLYRNQKGTSPVILRIPQCLTMKVQLVYSSYVDYCNRVDDDNVLGFRIGKYMNEYTGSEHPNLEKLDYSEYSSPITFALDSEGVKTSEVFVNKSGLVNSLYFWYELEFHDNITFSTLNSSHYKKSSFFLDAPRSVKSGDICRIRLKTEGLYLKLSLQ